MNLNLSDRKQRILGAIVEDYLHTAEPVGSRTISKNYLPGVSSATIRNEMADLEEEGYIEQPHTSAGRIPADAGYRYYVDQLMRPKNLTSREVDFVKKEYNQISSDIEDILKTTAKISSSLTKHATMITAPKLHKKVIKIVNMVLVDVHKAAIVLLTDSGKASNMVLKLPKANIEQNDLLKMSNLLTDKLNGVDVTRLNSTLIKEITSEMPIYRDILEDTLKIIKDSITKSQKEKILSAGLVNMVKQPEFNDVDQMKNLLRAIEHEDIISSIMRDDAEDTGVTIKIGSEIRHQEINGCSVVLKKYTTTEDSFGTLGIIGPTRMQYNKISSIIDHISNSLSTILRDEAF